MLFLIPSFTICMFSKDGTNKLTQNFSKDVIEHGPRHPILSEGAKKNVKQVGGHYGGRQRKFCFSRCSKT